MWFPCAHHVVSRWTPFGFQVDTMWFPGGQHRASKVDTMWFLQDTTGFPHGCHVVSIWTPCVVEVTTWKPAQKTALHEANWLPCCLFALHVSLWGYQILNGVASAGDLTNLILPSDPAIFQDFNLDICSNMLSKF